MGKASREGKLIRTVDEWNRVALYLHGKKLRSVRAHLEIKGTHGWIPAYVTSNSLSTTIILALIEEHHRIMGWYQLGIPAYMPQECFDEYLFRCPEGP